MNAFSSLLPDRICDALSNQGYDPTGQIFQLNSYENRVYQVTLEDKTQLIAKFYRPNRWNQAALIDEHRVLAKLFESEVAVVRPIVLKNSKGFETLGFDGDYYYCLYPKFGGHERAELTSENRRWLGRLLGRLHNITSSFQAPNRLELSAQSYGWDSLKSIQAKAYVPQNLISHLTDTISLCLEQIKPMMDRNLKPHLVHGDCHFGNILWGRDGPTLVDFDDMVIAPAIQDVWMLFFGSLEEQQEQRKDFLEGYQMFRDFDVSSFALIEPLRTLRLIRHAAWIGERFEEESFKRAFPYYTDTRYWQDLLLNLKEQVSLLQGIG